MLVSLTADQLKALIADAVRSALDLSKVGAVPSSSSTTTKVKKVKKERDPDAPKREPNDWIKFTTQVRSVLSTLMEEGKKVHPKAVTQTASKLKEAELMGSATDDQIVAAYKDWLANPPTVSKMVTEGRDKKSKKSVSSDGASTATPKAEAVAEKKKGGRKKLVDMTPEERAAHDAKKAAKKPAKAAAKVEATSTSSAAAAAEDSDGIMDFDPFTWKKMSLLKNARGDVLTEDMEWFGHWDAKTDKVDTSSEQPADLDL
jgi:hypothetical protein